jgi:hypothetical protein
MLAHGRDNTSARYRRNLRLVEAGLDVVERR